MTNLVLALASHRSFVCLKDMHDLRWRRRKGMASESIKTFVHV
jgi:hypothetical protein